MNLCWFVSIQYLQDLRFRHIRNHHANLPKRDFQGDAEWEGPVKSVFGELDFARGPHLVGYDRIVNAFLLLD